jgi:hypothetical protein
MKNSFKDIAHIAINSYTYTPTHNHLLLESEILFFPYTERHIQCLWADTRLRPKTLISSDQQPIHIHHPGRWNQEEGPDFLNAELSIGTPPRRLTGDLEVHIHPTDWHRHRHSHDPTYANVRFHLVHYPGPEIPGLIQIPLQSQPTIHTPIEYDQVDPTTYPFGHATTYPCAHLTPETITPWLESAGCERLQRKTRNLAIQLQTIPPEQLLWRELLAALGYKKNSTSLRQLAQRLPIADLEHTTPIERYALLIGTAGLLPQTLPQSYPTSTRNFIRQCWDIWWKQPHNRKENSMSPTRWNLSGLRPLNHPRRRLMAAAQLAPLGLQLLQQTKALTTSHETY